MLKKTLSGLCLRRLILVAICSLFVYPVTNLGYADDTGENHLTRASSSNSRQSPRDITRTRWIDPEGRQPISYLEWKAQIGKQDPFQIELVAESPQRKGTTEATKFCIIINTLLYYAVQPSVNQYVLDLTNEGYDVEVHTTYGGTPEELRAFLQDRYVSGLEGCVLIGDLPVPWYDAMWPDDSTHEQFPIDLFYMDLDGVFTDTDLDGLYDTHTGDVTPEIWVGRLTASPLVMDGAQEIPLLENYFTKNHLYRTDAQLLNTRALVYIDDDWAYWALEWSSNVGEAYAYCTTVSDEWTTWNTDYVNRLPQNYEFIQVCVHSSYAGHAFHRPGDEWGWVTNSEVKTLDPVAYFYNLFACSNARYVEEDYMAGWYIFCDTYGLAALGSTKSGSMLEFGKFYGPLSEGRTIGEAFMDWFAALAADGFDDWEISWHYGMTLCGDPTLGTWSNDSDHDGVADTLDNCPTFANPGQEDTDGDDIGDACDNCPDAHNPDQEDINGNGIGDSCEIPETWYVLADGMGEMPTIQAAIDSCTHEDTVLVAAGLYTGEGNRDLDPKHRRILVKSESGPELTIIDCQGSGTEPRRGFTFQNDEDSLTIIDGFTIRGGYGPLWQSTNCGGGMLFDNAAPKIKNCIFSGNSATLGGAVFSSQSSHQLVNCTFVENTAMYGSGVLTRNQSAVALDNCIVAFNTDDEAFSSFSGGTATLSCCDVFGNLGGDWTGCIAGQEETNGNFSADPIFCDPDAGGFDILVTSPCAAANNSCGELIGALDVGCYCDCGPLWGDVNNDGSLNPIDVAFMVNFVYLANDLRTQPPVCAYEAGDANCDGIVNPVDVVFYVSYVYLNITPFPCTDPCVE